MVQNGGPSQMDLFDPKPELTKRAGQPHPLMEKVSTNLVGLTLGCARCHSHKYDPIPQRDYY